MAPRPSLSELAGEEVAAAEEATAGAWDGLKEFAAALRRHAWSLGESEAVERPLEMSAGGSEKATSSRWSRRSGMLGRCLRCWRCCWWSCEGAWVIGLGFWTNGQGGGVVGVSAGMGSGIFGEGQDVGSGALNELSLPSTGISTPY